MVKTMINKNILFTLLLLLITGLSTATIDIYYPDNSTTDIWIGNQTNPDMYHFIGDTIATDDYTHIIIKENDNESIDLINEPIIFVRSFTKIFIALIFCFGIVMVAYIFRKVLK